MKCWKARGSSFLSSTISFSYSPCSGLLSIQGLTHTTLSLLLLSLLLLSTACCNLRRFWFCSWTSAPITASLSASMVIQFYSNFDQFRNRLGLNSTAARFQMSSWCISPCIYTQSLVPLRHLYTNAKPKFIAAMARCFNARQRSSNSVSARKTLTTAPPKFVQRLIAARATLANQRWSSVQDFCVGLAGPSVHELASSGAKLWMGVGGAEVNFARAENCSLLTARNILCSSKLSER